MKETIKKFLSHHMDHTSWYHWCVPDFWFGVYLKKQDWSNKKSFISWYKLSNHSSVSKIWKKKHSLDILNAKYAKELFQIEFYVKGGSIPFCRL